MIIIWGTTPVTTTLGKMDFACPHCGRTVPGERRSTQSHFTLFFLTLFPIGDPVESVFCRVCELSWDASRISLPTQKSVDASTAAVIDTKRRLHAVTRQTMLRLALVEGAPHPKRVARIAALGARLGGGGWSEDEIRSALGQGAPDPTDALREVAGSLGLGGKLSILESALDVARGSGPISERDEAELVGIAIALDVPAPQLEALLRS